MNFPIDLGSGWPQVGHTLRVCPGCLKPAALIRDDVGTLGVTCTPCGWVVGLNELRSDSWWYAATRWFVDRQGDTAISAFAADVGYR